MLPAQKDEHLEHVLQGAHLAVLFVREEDARLPFQVVVLEPLESGLELLITLVLGHEDATEPRTVHTVLGDQKEQKKAIDIGAMRSINLNDAPVLGEQLL